MRIRAKHSGVSLVAWAAVIGIALAFAPESFIQGLALDQEAVRNGELWRLWTAHLVHFSRQHALIDVLVFVIVGVVVEATISRRWVAWAIMAIAPTISLGLFVWSPDLMHYRGMSGLATAMTVMAMIVVARIKPSSRPLLLLLTVAMALKFIGDVGGISPDIAGLPRDVLVEWRAHALGAAAGVAAILVSLQSKSSDTSTGAALLE